MFLGVWEVGNELDLLVQRGRDGHDRSFAGYLVTSLRRDRTRQFAVLFDLCDGCRKMDRVWL